MTEEQFDELIDLIDDLRGDAYEIGSRKHYLEMLDNHTINRIRTLCGLSKE